MLRGKAGLIALVVLLLAVLSACGEKGLTKPPGHGPPSSQQVSLQGPLQSALPFEFDPNRPKGGQLQDVYVVQLLNTASQAVILDEVRLALEKNASPLRFAGAFVAPEGSNLGFVPTGQDDLKPLKGYRLKPVTKKHPEVPVLVLRVGPASAGQTDGFRFSRNNNINLFYHTPDGKRYDVVYPVRIEYPNA